MSMTTSLWTKPIRRRSRPTARMKASYAVKVTSKPVPSGRSFENASCPLPFRDAPDAPVRFRLADAEDE
jgi:hypothetical protein